MKSPAAADFGGKKRTRQVRSRADTATDANDPMGRVRRETRGKRTLPPRIRTPLAKPPSAVKRVLKAQNGLTITKMTMTIISSVGISLKTLKNFCDLLLRSRAKAVRQRAR